MGVSRISTSYIADRGIFNLQNNLSHMVKLQEKISSGKNIANPSDDPIGLSQLLNTTLEMDRDNRFMKNIEEGLAEMRTTEGSLASIVDIGHRARELAVQASNGTNSQDQLDAIANEVQGLIDQLFQVSNTKFAGKYIFSGFRTDTAPFTKTNDDIAYGGSDPAEPYEREIQIADNSNVALNVNGQNVFGDVTVTAPGPPPTTTGSGMFQVLTQLRLDLEAGDAAAMGRIRASIDNIVIEQKAISDIEADLGARINRLELTKNRIEDRKSVFSQEVARLQDIDLPKAISDLNFQQSVFQGSLNVMSRILQTSLVNFLG